MGWFNRKPSNEKQVDAVMTIATNMFLQTIPESEEAPVKLQFSLPDSRYRYLLFCLSTTVTAILAYDEKNIIHPDVLLNGCMQIATLAATKELIHS